MEDSSVAMLHLNVKCGISPPSSIQIEADKTIGELRQTLAEKYNSTVALTVIIHKGRIIKEDSQKVVASGISDGETIHLWIKSQQNSSQPKPAQSSTTEPTPATSSANTPFGLGGLGGLQGLQNLGFGSQNFAEIQQRMTREFMNNPESFRSLMESSMIQNLFRNPESLQAMLQSNPQLREIMDANPELAHALNNPEILRESMELANNPTMLLEMMRNHDRSLSNIENLPGGFNALQRLYTDIEEPMRRAVVDMNSTSTQPPAPPDAPGQSINAPLPNLWSSGPPRPSNTSQSATPQPSQGTAGLQSYVNQVMANPEVMRNMMQSPYMSSMLDSLSSNPEVMRNIVDSMPGANPQFRQQISDNMPAMLQQMRNPNVQQMLSNPRAMAAMLKIHEGMQELYNEAPDFLQSLTGASAQMAQTPPSRQTSQSGQTPQAAQNTQASNYFAMMSSLLNQRQNNQQLPPRERFATQLTQLESMGFNNTEFNIEVLERVSGDLNTAIDILLQRMNNS